MAKIVAYKIDAVPDRTDARLRAAAGGCDVLSAAGEAVGAVAAAVADMPPDAVGVGIRFVYDPNASDELERLGLFLYGFAEADEHADTVEALLNQGLDGPCVHAQRVSALPSISGMSAVRLVTRREEWLPASVSPDENDLVPDSYYVSHPLKADETNDWGKLDRTLATLKEPLVIDIQLWPVDTREDLRRLGAYCREVGAVNERGDLDVIDGFGGYDRTVQTLTPLRTRDRQADRALRELGKVFDAVRGRGLAFRTVVAGQSEASVAVCAHGLASGAFANDDYGVRNVNAEAVGLNEALRRGGATGVFFSGHPLAPLGLSRIAQIASLEELKGLFRLPVAGAYGAQTIRVSTTPSTNSKGPSLLIGDEVGRAGRTHRLPVAALPKSWFISGAPGSGKTNLMTGIVMQLALLGMPFIVIEPAKREYRSLKRLWNHADPQLRRFAENLRILTPGCDHVSPLRINPLRPFDGMTTSQQLSRLTRLFEAALPMAGSLPALLKEALEDVLDDARRPVIADLILAVERVMRRKNYPPDTYANLRGALDSRLGSLVTGVDGEIFQCPETVPSVDELTTGSTIIELDGLGKSTASLITFTLLEGIRHWATRTVTDGAPRLIVVLEEAHALIGGNEQTARASEENPDPSAFAVEAVANMLAEFRGLGVGLIIVDQLPSKVAADVIKQTATKTALRQISSDDREQLSEAMLLDPQRVDEMARLSVGQAFFHTEGFYRPVLLQTPRLPETLQ